MLLEVDVIFLILHRFSRNRKTLDRGLGPAGDEGELLRIPRVGCFKISRRGQMDTAENLMWD